MTFYLPAVSQVKHLEALMGYAWTLKLYKNDVTSGLSAEDIQDLTASDFTEASFTGYSAKTLGASSWDFVHADVSYASYPEQSFLCSANGAAQSIYGFYITDPDGNLLGFENIDAGPITIQTSGQSVVVNPLIYLPKAGNLMPVGSMILWPSNTPPRGSILCQGQAISRTTYSELYAVIGTTYGSGDGSSTFNLPDFRERMPIGKATSGARGTLGNSGGAMDHQHDLGSGVYAKWSAGASSNSDIDYAGVNTETYSFDLAYRNSGGSKVAKSGTRANGLGLGGDTVVDDANNPPFLVVNVAIKYAQV